MHFSVAKTGPLIGIRLDQLSGKTLRARVKVSGRALERLFLNERRHDPMFYVPLFQIALALNARAGVGDVELDEFEPASASSAGNRHEL